MSELRRCPQCSAVLPADAPAGLCPECLLRQGLESGDPWRASTVLGAGFIPPRPENLAPLFPSLHLLELLGKGGMGAVYKARQPALDRFVALKVLPPEVGRDPAFAERFAREARALARLSHQNIVSVYDFGQSLPLAADGGTEGPQPHEGLYYFVMEYVDGANLRQLIQQGSLTPAEALAIVPQICEALQFAHEEGIVHRDVKPENILIDKRGRVKIADFGLAKLLRVQPVDVTLTQANQVMGTWHYMAPEQIEHPMHVDHRADIYSLGVVFYEMLTGQLPLGRFEPPSKKANVDVRLDQVVLRALEREPERRYQYVSEVKTDLEAIGAVDPRADVAPVAALPELVTAPAVNTALEIIGGWLSFVLALFCAGLAVMGLGTAWQYATQGRWGGPTVEVDPQYTWLRWPLVGLGILLAVMGVVGLVYLGRFWSGSGRAAMNSQDTKTPGRRPLSKQEREAIFGEFIAVAVMLGLLGLVWFGMWITGSSWFLLALCLPWLVPGIAAELDEREDTTALVPWALAIAVLGTLGLLGYGIWLVKSGWPLLAIVMPFVGMGVAVALSSSDEESSGETASEAVKNAVEESEDWGCGTIVAGVILLNLVVIPLLGFVSGAVSDLSQVLIDAFEMDQRLQRPLLILLWGALVAGLAYAGYQIWRILSGEETPGTDGEAAVRERLRSRLTRAGFPLLVLVVLIVGSWQGSQPQQGATAPSVEPAEVDPRTRELLDAAGGGDATRVRELLSAGVDVNARDPQSGETALMRAAASGHTAIVLTLILLGADVNAQDRRGQTAVMRAAENGRTALLRSLYELRRLSWEPDADRRKTALRAFPGFDRSLIADRDLDLSNLSIEELLRDDNGETASIKAVKAADLECLDLVAATTDSYLARDKLGRNVLMHAAIHGQIELFLALEEERYFGVAGALNVFVGRMLLFDLEQSLGLLDSEGKSALHHAEEYSRQEIANLLRRHLQAIVAHQTREIEKRGENVARCHRLRGLAHQALGEREQAEADLAAAQQLRGQPASPPLPTD